MKKKLGLAAASIVGVFVALGLLGAGDVIDLPAWANVPGVDLPLVGDTDAIDCRLAQVDGSRNVEIRIVDGDDSTYPDYEHVWNNGNLVDPTMIDRQAPDFLIVPSTEGTDEQFYSISIEPVREGRVFCESLILE